MKERLNNVEMLIVNNYPHFTNVTAICYLGEVVYVLAYNKKNKREVVLRVDEKNNMETFVEGRQSRRDECHVVRGI